MRQDDRAPFDRALEPVRRAAYPPGEFVGQESFMDASEVLALAAAAGVGPGVRVLDVCCGTGGPGRLLVERTGCDYLGVDVSAGAVTLARRRAAGLPTARFEVAQVPPLPEVTVDVVLLLETVLAFADKPALVRAVADVLPEGGRFAFTVEEGAPLTTEERAAMPDADTVWPWPRQAMVDDLVAGGLVVCSLATCTGPHQRRATSLLQALTEARPGLVAALGERAVDDLLSAHRLWSSWLARGRVRKYAVVAERVG